MTDSSDDSSIVDRLKSTASAALQRATGAAEERLANLEERVEALGPQLADPQNVDRLQRTMSSVAEGLYGLGFTLDSDARLLFEYMDWVENAHGRRYVLQALALHNPLLGDEFLDVVRFASGGVSPDDDRRRVARESIDTFRQNARLDVLQFLALLAALESEKPPPEGGVDALVDYIEASSIPDRFKPLVDRALGPRGRTGSDAAAGTGSPDASDESGGSDDADADSLTGRLRKRVQALTRQDSGVGALVQGLAPLFDRHLHFLSVSFLFAAQGFMTRSAIEELPDIVDQSGLAADESDDVIDI